MNLDTILFEPREIVDIIQEEMSLTLRDYNPFVKISCTRDSDLEETFKSFNDIYFQGKLPSYQILICSRPRNFSHLNAGYCAPNDRRIYVRSGISRNAMLQTLTHEMIHAKLWWANTNSHGKAFIKELTRVRQLAAPLSSSEIDLAEGFEPPRLTKRNIEASIRDALEIENLPQRYVPKFLEREFCLPYSEIRKVADVAKIIAKISCLGMRSARKSHH